MISEHNEMHYLSDVVDTYEWIKLATTEPLDTMLTNEKDHKYFLEEFVATSIRNMILCKRFRNKIVMVYTQQIMLEALIVFKKFLPMIEKYPNMTCILKITFDYEKQFYRVNYINHNYFPVLIWFYFRI